MGSFMVRGKSLQDQKDEIQIILEEIAVGDATKTFVEQYWKLRIYMHGGFDSAWNIKLENITKTKTVLNLTNQVLLTQAEKEELKKKAQTLLCHAPHHRRV